MKEITKNIVLALVMIVVVGLMPSFTIKASASSGIDDFVTRCYSVALHREPEAEGFAFWKGKLENREMVGSTIAYSFIFSQEYLNQEKTDEEFVNDLYAMFLGRAADKVGYEFWCDKISEGWTREDVFAGFANSIEFDSLCLSYGISAGFYTNEYPLEQVNNVNLFVERLYKTCLSRLGDQDGQKFWVEGMLEGNYSGISCASNFINSVEYKSLDMSDVMYVENLYAAFMGRGSDSAGKLFWLELLANGEMTRDQVFEGFAKSFEFSSICESYQIEVGDYVATDLAEESEENNGDEDDSLVIKTEILDDGTVKYDSFDEKGTLVYSVEYYASGVIKSEMSINGDGYPYYTYYNENGVRVCEKGYSGQGSPLIRYYDANGKTSSEEWYNPGGIRFVDEYDSGNMTKRTGYDSNDEIILVEEFYSNGNIKHNKGSNNGTIYEYYYNEEGKQIKRVSYNSDGSVNETEVTEYYESGEVSKRTTYDSDGNLTLILEFYLSSDAKVKHRYRYDIDGNVIEITENYASGKTKYRKYINEYGIWETFNNEDGKTLKELSYDFAGVLQSKKEYEYDEVGAKIHEVTYDATGTITYEWPTP